MPTGRGTRIERPSNMRATRQSLLSCSISTPPRSPIGRLSSPAITPSSINVPAPGCSLCITMHRSTLTIRPTGYRTSNLRCQSRSPSANGKQGRQKKPAAGGISAAGSCMSLAVAIPRKRSAMHQHGVDHMDDAVRLHHVLDGDLGGIALGVPHPQSAVLGLERQLLAFDCLERGLAAVLLDHVHDVLGGIA